MIFIERDCSTVQYQKAAEKSWDLPKFSQREKKGHRGLKEIFRHIKELQSLNRADKRQTFGEDLPQKPIEASALCL